jgi:hypothetical protein
VRRKPRNSLVIVERAQVFSISKRRLSDLENVEHAVAKSKIEKQTARID